MATKIVQCTCKNDGQDKLHGQGNRVANETTKAHPQHQGKHTYRCTSCGREH